ncbi:MAG: gamma-glutamylcyclotransferase family protein [Sphaerochaetaceae bacterium]|jgi:gamma-glutamylcyclotransferase (GGCT)/AIG2-like uncharacterized protein YtfP
MLRQLIELKDEMVEDRFASTSASLFEGAGLVICEDGEIEETGNFIQVKTPHARDLSALIYRLKDICKDQLDYLNKYAFYGRLGEAANRSLEKNSDKKSIFLDVVDEALRFLEKVETIRYFAYGSNMDETQMVERCPSAKMVEVAKLKEYRFALDSAGVATVISDQDNLVWGIVWEICGCDIVNLDRYEGIKTLCYRHSFLQIEGDGRNQEALIYISNRNMNHGVRRTGYLNRIITAARKLQFPEDYIASLACLK